MALALLLLDELPGGSEGAVALQFKALAARLQKTTVEGLQTHVADMSNPHDVTAAQVGAVPLSYVTSGVYTPALTAVTNVAASTAYQCQYLRVGTTVTVSGRVDIDPTGAGATELGLSLPVVSDLATAQQCGGVAFGPAVAGHGAAIVGDATNDRASVQFVTVDTANRALYFSFTYQVL